MTWWAFKRGRPAPRPRSFDGRPEQQPLPLPSLPCRLTCAPAGEHGFRGLCYAVLGPEVVSWAEQALDVPVRDPDGRTHHGMVIANGWADGIRSPVRPGSMGRPLPGWSAEILHDDRDEPAPAGTAGRVAIRVAESPLMWFSGNTGAPAKTDEPFSANGRWYLTGDAGTRGADGYFLGRRRRARRGTAAPGQAPVRRTRSPTHRPGRSSASSRGSGADRSSPSLVPCPVRGIRRSIPCPSHAYRREEAADLLDLTQRASPGRGSGHRVGAAPRPAIPGRAARRAGPVACGSSRRSTWSNRRC
nr:AMP-binding protein [Streptomyces griseoruber]